jgi:ribosome-associated translation inhibitor RaiA
MNVQVAAHGFELTDGLKAACETESQEKLQLLALHNFSTKWILSLERNEHVAHLTWADGGFRGDVKVHSEDMYKSISQCTKKAVEQIKKAHQKRNGHKGSPAAKAIAVGQVRDAGVDDGSFEDE